MWVFKEAEWLLSFSASIELNFVNTLKLKKDDNVSLLTFLLYLNYMMNECHYITCLISIFC